MLKKILDFSKKEQLLAQGDRLVVGVSGGADSMCLLFVLEKLQKTLGLKLHVVHVHHGIRGEEADCDAEFVRRFCEDHGISCKVVRISVPGLAKTQGIGLEEAGRKARYDIFRKEAARVGAGKLAVAHHQSDQAETLLFRMLRGTGIRGLAGMKAKSILFGDLTVIRPLLCVSRQEILDWLFREGQEYCTDSTNACTDYSRNYIRNRVMPLLCELNPRAEEHLAELAAQAAEWREWTEKETEQAYRLAGSGQSAEKKEESEACYGACVTDSSPNYKSNRLRVSVLRELPGALRRELLLRWLQDVSGKEKDWTAAHVQACEGLLWQQSGREIHLPCKIRVVRSADFLTATENPHSSDNNSSDIHPSPKTENVFFEGVVPKQLKDGGQKIPLPGGRILEISLNPAKKDLVIKKNKCTKWFDYGKIRGQLMLRTRRAGDYLVITTDGQRKLLQDYFVDAHIPKEERDRMVLLAAGQQVLWVLGHRNSENCRVDEKTRWVLTVRLCEAGMEDAEIR